MGSRWSGNPSGCGRRHRGWHWQRHEDGQRHPPPQLGRTTRKVSLSLSSLGLKDEQSSQSRWPLTHLPKSKRSELRLSITSQFRQGPPTISCLLVLLIRTSHHQLALYSIGCAVRFTYRYLHTSRVKGSRIESACHSDRETK